MDRLDKYNYYLDIAESVSKRGILYIGIVR